MMTTKLLSALALVSVTVSVASAQDSLLPLPRLPFDPWKNCANYEELKQVLKGDETFIATGFSLKCDWRNSDVQPSIVVTNNRNVYFAPGSQIFYCTAGGTTGKHTLWQNSLAANGKMTFYVPFGSGNTCLAKGVIFSLRNPPQ